MFNQMFNLGFSYSRSCPDFLFIIRDVPEDFDFNEEALKLNFLHLCPFKSCKMLYIAKKNKLMVWLYKEEERQIPLCLVYIISLLNRELNSIIIIDDNEKYSFFVVKDGIVLSSFQVSRTSDISYIIRDLQVKYHIAQVNKLNIKQIKYAFLVYTKGYLELIKFKLKHANISYLTRLLTQIFILTSLLLALINIIKLSQLYFLWEKNNRLEKVLKVLNIKAADAKGKFSFLEKQSKLWSSLKGRLDQRLHQIAEILKIISNNATVQTLVLSDDLLTLELFTRDLSWLRKLNRLNFITSLNLESVSNTSRGKFIRMKLKLR